MNKNKMQNIFSESEDINKNISLNVPELELDNIDYMFHVADGFGMSVEILLQNIIDSGDVFKRHRLAYPIFFEINHYIELYIKGILMRMNQLYEAIGEEKSIKIPGYHDIKGLTNILNSEIKKLDNNGSEIKTLNRMTKGLRMYIDEIYENIESTDEDGKRHLAIDFARYPIDTKGNPQFYVLESQQIIGDAENMLQRFKDIKLCLGSLSIEFNSRLNYVKENQGVI